MQHIRFGGLCLLAGLAACSYDASKLRAPHDAPVDRPAAPDLGEDGLRTPDSAGRADADAPVAISDAAWDGFRSDPVDLAQDVADDAPTEVPDAMEAARPTDDATDSAATDDGHGGEGGNSDGYESEVGSGGTGGGSGGMGGTGGGSGGSGGTGGGSGGIGGGSGGSAGTGGAGGTVGTGGTSFDPDLVLWYKFDESTGTKAADSSGSAGARDGTLASVGAGSSAKFSTDHQVGTHALGLTPAAAGGGYVTVPAPAALAPDAITVAVWVKLAAATAAQNWERIFDFGSGTGSDAPYMCLTARSGDAGTPVAFRISRIGHSTTDERLDSPAPLPPNEWHHIAVVLPSAAVKGGPYTGALYIDGVAVAANSAMTIHLSDVGTTTMNWLGRSPFSADPYFNGLLDDFRIYKRALSTSDINALIAFR